MNTPAISDKIPIKMKFGYGIGDFSFNLLINTTSVFLLYFYTDIFQIGGMAAGTIFLVSKLWNAAIDPFIGAAVDRTRSRWGGKRPYMLFGAIPTAAIFYMIFAAPELDASSRYVYAMVTFLLFNSAFALTNVPYAALTASMTSDANERTSLTTFRMSSGIIGMFMAAVLTKPVVKLFGGGAGGYRVMAVIFGLVGAAIILISFKMVRERVVEERHEQINVSANMKAMGKNYPFILLVLAFVISATAVYTIIMMVNYFFKYNYNNEDMTSVALGVFFVTALLFLPFWMHVSKRTSKKIAFITGLTIFTATLVAIFLIDDLTMVQLISILAISGAGMSAYMLFPWAMVADTVEFSLWKSGVQQEGFLYGFFIFGLKLAQAFAGFLAGFSLEKVGYVANTVQSPETLRGIKFIMTLMPIGFIVVAILLLFFYPINADMHRAMLDDIASRDETEK